MSDRMWRGVSGLRVLALGYAAVLIIADHNRYAHPAGGLAALAVMAGWSALTIVAYARPGRRSRWLVIADVAVAAALIMATRWVDTPARIDHGAPTLPTFWAATSVLACAVAGGAWGAVWPSPRRISRSARGCRGVLSTGPSYSC